MELRTLRYFLAAASEENMSHAAQMLHVTQSALSKQIRTLEEELGKRLFIRHSSSIELTEEGILLRKRAEDLVRMADRIKTEFLALDDVLGGDVYMGLAESYQIRYLAAAIRECKKTCPGLRYHITSGDTEQVTEKLDRGLLDFAVLAEQPNPAKYHFLRFPTADVWGLIVPEDSDLAQRDTMTVHDLLSVPLLCSEQAWEKDISKWAGDQFGDLHLEGSFRLAYNGSLFVKEGLGCLLTFQDLVDTGPGSGLVFRPLRPQLETNLYLIWAKHHVFSPIAGRLLTSLKSTLSSPNNEEIQKRNMQNKS